jgi:branched-chain amino acid transport system permease protein
MISRTSALSYGIGIAVLLALPAVVTSDYDVHIFVMVGIFSLLVIGFNLIFGYLGQLSLGHTAYFAIGAYTSALVTLKWGVSFWIGLPLAGVMSGIFGFVIGAIALRWRSHFFVIATICFWGIIHLIILNWVSLTSYQRSCRHRKHPRSHDRMDNLFHQGSLLLPPSRLCLLRGLVYTKAHSFTSRKGLPGGPGE